MKADDMLWEDPPPSKRSSHNRWTQEFAARCAEHPGKWAKVVNVEADIDMFGSSTIGSLHRHGLQTRMTSFAADGERLPNGLFRIWARMPEEVES